MSLRHVKPQVRALRAYTLAAREAAVKLDQNENPWDVPEPLKRLVLERVARRAWRRYPAFEPQALRAALAAHAGWRADGVLAGNGSNELIQAFYSLSEIAYPYDENRKVHVFKPLERQEWMKEQVKILPPKKVKIRKDFLPVGLIIGSPNRNAIN